MKSNKKTVVKKHIVFDFDDTIADTNGFNQNMFVETFKKVDPNMNRQAEMFLRNLHLGSVGLPMSKQFKKALTKLRLKNPVNQMVNLNEELHFKNSSSIQIFNGIEIFLEQLKKSDKTISICTNRQTASLINILEKNKIEKYFTNIISCADFKHEKPDPHCLRMLIGKSKVQEFIYFGDSETDSRFAKNAGVDYVIVDQHLHEKRYFELISSIFNI